MVTDKNIVNVLLIGENIETRIVFKNALSKLSPLCTINDHYCLDRAVAHPGTLMESKPDFIFLDTNTPDVTHQVRKIRDCDNFKDCSLVVYDSDSRLRDANSIFSEGADVFINQPYDFSRLKKVIGQIVATNWDAARCNGSKQSYFL